MMGAKLWTLNSRELGTMSFVNTSTDWFPLTSKQKVAIVKLPESSFFTSEFKTHIHTTSSIVFSGLIIFGLMKVR